MSFGLSAQDWDFLERTIIIPLKNKGAKIWVFGSRATGKHQKFSDIDFLIDANTSKVPDSFLSTIREALENSKLPIKVDLVRESELAESYKFVVNSQKVLI